MESKNKKKKNVIQKQDDRKELLHLREQDGQVATADAFPEVPEMEAPATTPSEHPEALEMEAPATTPSEHPEALEMEAPATTPSEALESPEEEALATASSEPPKVLEEEAPVTATSEAPEVLEEEAPVTATSELLETPKEEIQAITPSEPPEVSEEETRATVTFASPEASEEETAVTAMPEVIKSLDDKAIMAAKEVIGVKNEEIGVITTSEVPDTTQEEEETPTIVTPVVDVNAVVTPVSPDEMTQSSDTPAPECSSDQDRSGDCVAEEVKDDVAEEVTDDVAEEATDDVVEKTTDDVAEKTTDDVAEKAKDDVAEKAKDDVVEETTDDVAVQKTVTMFDSNEVRVVESVPPGSEVAAKRQSALIVPADSVQAEEVPTVSIGDLQVLKELEPEVSVHSVASMRALNLPTPLVVQPAEYRRGPGEWIEIWRDGMRFKYMPLSLLPVILGGILAWTQSVSKQYFLGHLDIIRFIASIIAVILMQVGANLINDYYDYKRGIDTSNVLGPGGLIQQGLIKPTRVLMTGLTVLVIGTIIGLVFALAGGALAVLMVVLLALVAYFFSAGRRSLSSLGLSELVGFLAFGPLTVIAGYLMQTHGVYATRALVYSLPLGLLGAAVVYANNLRDAEGDQHAGKYTLATLFGLRLSRFVYTLLLLAADAVIVGLGVRHGGPHLILISLWTLPILAVAISGILRTQIAAGFHDVMKQTLKLQTCIAILLMIALIVSKVFSSLAVTLPTIKLPFL